MKNSLDKRVVLLVSALSSFISPFTSSAVNIALPAIQAEFAIDAILLSWTATAYLLASAIFLVPCGRLADLYGRRRFLTLGITTHLFASLLAAFSPTALLLLVSRFLQGIGGSMITGTSVAILASVFPPDQLGSALGINVTGVYLGLSLGPTLGGILTQEFGWRTQFLIMIPVSIVILLVLKNKVNVEWIDTSDRTIDVFGAIAYGISLLSLMLGLSIVPKIESFILIGVGSAIAVVFVLWERHVSDPILNIPLFLSNRMFTLSNMTAIIVYSGTFAIGFLLSLYLQLIKALPPREAGMVLLVQPIIRAFVSPLIGRLADIIEPRILVTTGLCVTTIGLMLFATVTATTPLLLILLYLVLLGSGIAVFSAPNTNAIMGSVDSSLYGVASASLGTMRLIGDMMSMGIVTISLTLFLGPVPLIPVYYPLFMQSMTNSFLLFTIIMIVGIIVSVYRGKNKPR
ncbi:MAG: MFS transporter [Candidatus Ranarchaeia archaeon]